MRELKFRAWLPGIKKMTYAHSLEELMGWGTKEWTRGTAVWMQWTGLTDKNGADVYEGDIISNGLGVGEVEWVQEHCAYMIRSVDPHRYSWMESDGQLKYTEVVGNIHQHSELMPEVE